MPLKDMPSWHSEIVALHKFFQNWYNGTIPDNPDSLQRVITVWPDDFSIIFPDGRIATRSEVLDQLKRDHNSDSVFRIEIKNLRLRWLHGEMALVFYEEWHSDQKEIEVRCCSALLQAKEDTPNGWIWLHIHESPLHHEFIIPN